MNSIKLSTTAYVPSRFAMPTCGQSFGVAVRGSDARGTTVPAVVRDWTGVLGGMDATDATATKGHLGLIPAYFPGTTAWRPPIC